MYQRHLSHMLRLEAGRMPVVTVTGPRQSGKTTLVRHTFPNHTYVTLERPDVRARAAVDPLGLLADLSGGAILDEVQRSPDLLSYLQGAVDDDPTPGRFILTGSQNLLLMERVSQTLAGRTALLELMALTHAELVRRPPPDPARLHMPDTAPGPASPPWEHIWRGSYPRIHAGDLDPTRWLADYERTYVERDLRDVLRVLDLDAFARFLRLAAPRPRPILNQNELAAHPGKSHPTPLPEAAAWTRAH